MALGLIIMIGVLGVVGVFVIITLSAWIISIGVTWGMRKAREEIEKEKGDDETTADGLEKEKVGYKKFFS